MVHGTDISWALAGYVAVAVEGVRQKFLLRSGSVIIVIIHSLWNGDIYVSQDGWCDQRSFRFLLLHGSRR